MHTFLPALHKSCIPRVTHALHTFRASSPGAPPHSGPVLLHAKTRSELRRSSRPALGNGCNYANLRRRLPVETKYENVSIPDKRATLQPGTTRKSSLTFQMGQGWRGLLRSGHSHGTTLHQLQRSSHTRPSSYLLPEKEKAPGAGNETAIGTEIGLQPQVRWSRSTVSATYRFSAQTTPVASLSSSPR